MSASPFVRFMPVEEEDKENPLGSLRNLVTHFNDFRRENKLCDAVLQVRSPEGVTLSFSAHKLVLVMTSKYFKSLSKEDLKAKCEFFLQDVTAKGLGLLLDYMYGLKIDPAVHYSCVEEIVNAATVLQVDSYLKHARSIIKRGRKIAEMAQMMSHPLDKPMNLSSDVNLALDAVGRSRGESVSQSPDSTQNAPVQVHSTDQQKLINAAPVFPAGASNLTCSTASLLNQSGGQCTTPSGSQALPNTQPMYLMMQGVNGLQNFVLPAAGLPQYQLPALGFLPGMQVPPGGQLGKIPTEELRTAAADIKAEVAEEAPRSAKSRRSPNGILDFSKGDPEVANYLNSHPERTVHRRKQRTQRFPAEDTNQDANQPIDLSKVKSEVKVKSEPPDDCYFGYQTPPFNGALRLNIASASKSGAGKSINRQVSCESVVSPSAARAAASVVDFKGDLGERFEYKCDVCPEHFQFKSFLVRHEKKTHKYHYQSFLAHKGRYLKYLQRDRKSRRHSCKTCFRKYSQESDLRSHLAAIHTYKRCPKKSKKDRGGDGYRLDHFVCCSFCKQEFTSKKSLSKHIKELHLAKSKRFPCDKCSRSFAMPESLQRHRSYKHKVKVTPKEPALDIHGSMFYPDRDKAKVKVDNVSGTFSALQLVRASEAANPPRAQWICHLCSLVYNQRSLLMKHLQIIHNIETPNIPLSPTGEMNRPNDTFKARWICHACSLYFGHRWSLLRHLELMHRIDKPQVQPVYGHGQTRDDQGCTQSPQVEEVKPEPAFESLAAAATPPITRPVHILPRPSVFPEMIPVPAPPEKTNEPVPPERIRVPVPPPRERHNRRSSSMNNMNNSSPYNVCPSSMATTSPVQESILETRANIQAPAYSQMTFKLIKSKKTDPKNGKNDYTLKLWPRKEMVSFGNKWSVYKCTQCGMPFRRIQCFTKHMTKVHGMPFAMAQVDTDNMAATNTRSSSRSERRSEKKEVSYNFKQYIPPDEHGNDHYTKFRKT
ncbi:zinc finger and BTB domain-containing protein 49-like isoform X2 [Lineus longissimus]|uniref:zinc finger and BTB domain-containing protein 49-like isoform X2 n=1 Tax=Lineus longissimus TaxID=88925 RepID=UPI00315D4263